MTTLEHRRFSSSLVLLFKCMKWNGPEYIKNFFQLREYNLRNKGVNLVQPGYNNRFYHNSFTYNVGHLWNSLPRELKTASKLSDFCCKLKTFDFSTLQDLSVNVIHVFDFHCTYTHIDIFIHINLLQYLSPNV